MQQEVKTKKLELKLRHAESLEDFFEENEQNLKAKTVSEYSKGDGTDGRR